MNIVKRNFRCTGCGNDRPCFVQTNQEIDNSYDTQLYDLKCILDETNQTSYNWEEIDIDNIKELIYGNI